VDLHDAGELCNLHPHHSGADGVLNPPRQKPGVEGVTQAQSQAGGILAADVSMSRAKLT
jgi:hypothetical protein